MAMDPKAVKSDLVLILDFGSQYTHLITRRIRSLSVFSLCISGTSDLKSITDLNPSVVILSGGPHSVHTLTPPPSLTASFNGPNPTRLGGEVCVGHKQEYGRMEINVEHPSALFPSEKVGHKQLVWMSHGDEATTLPPGFHVVARSQQGAVAAIENPSSKFYGLQYHPEVTHTPEGMETLRHFLFNVCGVEAGWKMEDVMEEEIKVIKDIVGTEEHVICALSGGVDSTVAATLVHKAIGDRLHCVLLTMACSGFLNKVCHSSCVYRYKERERVMETFEKDLHLPVVCVDASNQFLSKLKGVTDPEMKRKIIGKEFICIFDAFAQELEQKLGKKPAYLVQGTLYPDVIESCPPPGSGRTHSHTIKSHHNVGGRILEVPEGFLKRHPFPGPGLAVRVLGDVTEGNALEILRQVDEIFIQSIKDAGLYDSIWQAFAVFLPVRSVGVQGDQRTHSHVVALRAVTSQDGMTADWYYFEHKFLDDVARKICNGVRGVNRVVQDITSKPPSTIEWE
ncbi:Rossmann-like alpha/beta/alpha sandwich fold [Sesbania bispinosa]|nr:Rossmann-like alpha/beta/alpha sandwich fold [Sesbania bispinosa]